MSDLDAPGGPDSGISELAAPGGDQGHGGPDAGLAYVRVANDIAARIASGELAPGTRLRAERELAVHYEVSYGTMRHAAKVLREKEMIFTIHGRGTFVR
jgi:GntR family transcriptional regulator